MTESTIVPHNHDILLGRGGNNNRHDGNEMLRSLARKHATQYRRSAKKRKSALSRDLVKQVRCLKPPGRFLKLKLLPNGTRVWNDVGDDAAREKTSQVLRDAVGALENNKTRVYRRKNKPEKSWMPLTDLTEPPSQDPAGCKDEFQVQQAQLYVNKKSRRNAEYSSERLNFADAHMQSIRPIPMTRNAAYQPYSGFPHRPSHPTKTQSHIYHASHTSASKHSTQSTCASIPSIQKIVTPQLSECWRDAGYHHHTTSWASVHNVRHGCQGTSNWNGHIHKSHDNTHQPDLDHMRLTHHDSWDMALDSEDFQPFDDLSWIS